MAHSRRTKIFFIAGLSVVIVSAIAALLILLIELTAPTTSRGPTSPAKTAAKDDTIPNLKVDIVATSLSHPWDIAFLPSGEMLTTERAGRLLMQQQGTMHEVEGISDVYAQGEGGLMGLVVDRKFKNNQFIYVCYASEQRDVRVVRGRLDVKQTRLTDKKVIVDGIPLNQSGRHSGCRVRMDSGNVLWIGTGDAAIGTYPQDPKSLGGKILCVLRDGKAAKGNLGNPFDARIFSYGHRNTQGMALFKKPVRGSAGFSIEHGPSEDDEVNRLVKGNFGWNPVPFYNERVPMTDTKTYPNAIKALWSSGSSTIAPSGATQLSGKQWKAWNGALAIAVLKDEHLRIQMYDDDAKLLTEDIRFKDDFGRLRSAVQGIDGNLYLSTDNGNGGDRIIKIIPQ